MWWLWERFTDAHTAAYRATNGKHGGTHGKAPVALVESIGRKSGKRRTHPLLATKDGDNIVVVASNGGVHKHPSWHHNLLAHPEPTVHSPGAARRLRARETKREGRVRPWQQLTAVYPSCEDYQRRTERRVPVILLEPN